MKLINVKITTENKIFDFNAKTAETDEEEENGLAYEGKPSDNEGMFYFVPDNCIAGMWTPDTPFSVDYIFINSSNKIVKISTAQPFSHEMHESDEARYVFEVRGGLCKDLGINIGNSVEFDNGHYIWEHQTHGWGIDTSRLKYVLSQKWWNNATIEDVKTMNSDGPYLELNIENEKLIDFAIKNCQNEEVKEYLIGCKSSSDTECSDQKNGSIAEKKIDSIAIEEEFLNKLAVAYTTYDCSDLESYLDDDVTYDSFWVWDQIKSKVSYLDYLRGKLKAMQKTNKKTNFVMMHRKHCLSPVLMLSPKTPDGGYGAFSVNVNEKGLIESINISPASFSEPLFCKDEEKYKRFLEIAEKNE